MTSTTVGLITGGSSGIGAATAQRLLARGDSVAITGRSPQRLAVAAERWGLLDRPLTLTGDAADPDTVDGWVRACLERFVRLDIAVANAGYGLPAGWRTVIRGCGRGWS
ncbi:MAG TPA: SDR family oxidoreductase [Pseudonocardiaceae bacterium]|jgi:NAD(P)-dependent dehydrogenase (short-subunit alcohol dehydrogenase family)